MKTKTKTTKKKNPQDATFRNINALKKRVERLEAALAIISICTKSLTILAGDANARLSALEGKKK